MLEIEPDAWMELFGIEDEKERQQVNEKVLRMVRESERSYEDIRREEGRTVLGRDLLAAAHLDLDYVPQRKGKKMWCICDDVDLRVRYIEWAKSLKKQARAVYERWKAGDYSVKYPPGVFPPAVPKIANMTRLAVCY